MHIDINQITADTQIRMDLLRDRIAFHSLCSFEFLQALNSGRVQGPVNENLRKALALAVNYHQGVYLTLYVDLQVLKQQVA
jgi:hypothetical protein